MKFFGLALSSAVLAACSSQNAGEAQNSQTLDVKPTAPGVYSLVECNLSEKDLREYFQDFNIKGDQAVSIHLKIDLDGSKTLSGSIKTPEWSSKLGATYAATKANFKSLPIAKVSFFPAGGHSPDKATIQVSGEIAIDSQMTRKNETLNEFRISGASGSDEFSIGFSKEANNYLALRPLLFIDDYPFRKCGYRNMDLLEKLSLK